MNTEPLKKYIKAIKAQESGNSEEAAQLLAESVGADRPTLIMKNSLGNMLDANDAVLTLILHESGKES